MLFFLSRLCYLQVILCIEESKKRTHIPTLPQVEGLENNVAIFLSSAKRFLEKTHEFLCLFYDAPNSSSNKFDSVQLHNLIAILYSTMHGQALFVYLSLSLDSE
jgi:hypothetical protein